MGMEWEALPSKIILLHDYCLLPLIHAEDLKIITDVFIECLWGTLGVLLDPTTVPNNMHYYYYPHLTDEETEAQRGKGTSPRLPSRGRLMNRASGSRSCTVLQATSKLPREGMCSF